MSIHAVIAFTLQEFRATDVAHARERNHTANPGSWMAGPEPRDRETTRII
jgi:hypothetical protein